MLNQKIISRGCKIRVNILCVCILIIFSALLYQLVRIQIIDHKKYSSLAFSQQCKKQTIPTRRGLIFDRGGAKLAESIQVGSVYADPFFITEKKKTSKILSDLLGLDKAEVVKLLSKKKRFVWIKRRISDEQEEALRPLHLKGISIKHEYKRVYPYEKLCSQVLGFTDIDENGLGGIERSLNQVISGSNGSKVVEKDGLQHQFSTLKGETVSARYGDSVFLTIDCNVQSIVEEELEKACLKWDPNSAIAIAMDPSTGEVLAMANYPTFDPNFVRDSNPAERRNRAITDCFEPGSLIKPLIVSGALDSGLVKEDETIFCYNGAYKVNGGRRVVRDSHSYGDLSVSDIVVHSSNIGMAQIGQRIKKQRLHRYLKDFAFGEKTGIQLPGEVRGIVRPLNLWSVDSEISVSFGYETAVTPIQMVAAFCSIANGGTLLQPQIVSKITDYSGKRVKKNYDPARIRRVVSPKIAREVMAPILENVVKEGTGKRAMLFTHRVAGKTGTAKKLEKVGNKMKYSNKYIGSFVGFAPADEPKICVLVSLNEPKNGAYYGGTVAAPAVGNILERTLGYMEFGPQYVQIAQR
ncbi:MAG: penicillin-binding protein 2 [Candidatus Scalindua sp.]|jgi:cell division protein FtsI (penicillin-binding protein 3)|nr:penicillin-binding protein 2 [Candidatus Scalindua sp.]MBT5307544.1 penicillin-binding protein 2 [Candidatus Scalindua sp.]MBT6226526.1 penicillin-binding protein 2 [Candidatus Scalindua sp.]MBT6565199.1 penicillin-binding protein 2 [Candidatus Scalindua sp.]MBT7210328.1 penicillin-binding protein 2 [Candidatus Scalindua sp.]